MTQIPENEAASISAQLTSAMNEEIGEVMELYTSRGSNHTRHSSAASANVSRRGANSAVPNSAGTPMTSPPSTRQDGKGGSFAERALRRIKGFEHLPTLSDADDTEPWIPISDAEFPGKDDPILDQLTSQWANAQVRKHHELTGLSAATDWTQGQVTAPLVQPLEDRPDKIVYQQQLLERRRDEFIDAGRGGLMAMSSYDGIDEHDVIDRRIGPEDYEVDETWAEDEAAITESDFIFSSPALGRDTDDEHGSDDAPGEDDSNCFADAELVDSNIADVAANGEAITEHRLSLYLDDLVGPEFPTPSIPYKSPLRNPQVLNGLCYAQAPAPDTATFENPRPAPSIPSQSNGLSHKSIRPPTSDRVSSSSRSQSAPPLSSLRASILAGAKESAKRVSRLVSGQEAEGQQRRRRLTKQRDDRARPSYWLELAGLEQVVRSYMVNGEEPVQNIEWI